MEKWLEEGTTIDKGQQNDTVKYLNSLSFKSFVVIFTLNDRSRNESENSRWSSNAQELIDLVGLRAKHSTRAFERERVHAINRHNDLRDSGFRPVAAFVRREPTRSSLNKTPRGF